MSPAQRGFAPPDPSVHTPGEEAHVPAPAAPDGHDHSTPAALSAAYDGAHASVVSKSQPGGKPIDGCMSPDHGDCGQTSGIAQHAASMQRARAMKESSERHTSRREAPL